MADLFLQVEEVSIADDPLLADMLQQLKVYKICKFLCLHGEDSVISKPLRLLCVGE